MFMYLLGDALPHPLGLGVLYVFKPNAPTMFHNGPLLMRPCCIAVAETPFDLCVLYASGPEQSRSVSHTASVPYV